MDRHAQRSQHRLRVHHGRGLYRPAVRCSDVRLHRQRTLLWHSFRLLHEPPFDVHVQRPLQLRASRGARCHWCVGGRRGVERKRERGRGREQWCAVIKIANPQRQATGCTARYTVLIIQTHARPLSHSPSLSHSLCLSHSLTLSFFIRPLSLSLSLSLFLLPTLPPSLLPSIYHVCVELPGQRDHSPLCRL